MALLLCIQCPVSCRTHLAHAAKARSQYIELALSSFPAGECELPVKCHGHREARMAYYHIFAISEADSDVCGAYMYEYISRGLRHTLFELRPRALTVAEFTCNSYYFSLPRIDRVYRWLWYRHFVTQQPVENEVCTKYLCVHF